MPTTQRYFIELAYNGTNYHGWQIQPNAVTVQELLDKALSTLLRTPIETIGAGRTDTGVHAKQLYAHFNVMENGIGKMEDVDIMENGIGNMEDVKTPPSSILPDTSSISQTPSSILSDTSSISLRGLNALLPYDIAVKRIITVHADAHARFDATQRSYEYHIHFEKDPFMQNLSWQVRDIPDVELMNQAAQIIMEYTDFSAFSKSNTQVFTNNCKITRAEWIMDNGKLTFHISADRFLRNMVRAIVGTLMEVGKGNIQPEDVRKIIESKNRSNAGTSVPACGLYLTEVKYPYIAP
ncbi:MAG: tRNA pseudouridine(38-40) synthase TruA [Mucilaginibacter sp.]|uniref:tRNA pseudouridine(38-40) synthase TruA n=1 Tax=Mucilaginibacter sp. TaxID=1882438 RepID=UPI003264CBD4